jgi:hypothetical protein
MSGGREGSSAAALFEPIGLSLPISWEQAPATVGVDGPQGEEDSTGATDASSGERERFVVGDGWDRVS